MNSDTDAKIEVETGRELELQFEGKLCIHSRFCVLQAPMVFKANTPGRWIDPDALNANRLSAVAQNCPSGAITYTAQSAALQELPPPVNVIRIRENGPYAVSAELNISGVTAVPVMRRTLCRCGASGNKPYCDGSHAHISFKATGEPPAFALQPLAARGGPVRISMLPNGPLEVSGPIEFVSGTGRTFAKSSHCLLCRCGGSSIKPFCDGTHSLNGFKDGPATDHPSEARRDANPVSLAQWAGGRDKLVELTERFYAKVPQDSILKPVFANMHPTHARQVANFIAEVFGGGPVYSNEGGTHVGMIAKHVGRHITEIQRSRWLQLMLETAAEVGLPTDAAVRDAFHSYLDWGSRLAIINSAPNIEAPKEDLPMPRWGWGPAGGSGPER